MKNLTLYLIAVVGSAGLLVNGQDLANNKETPRELPGWGTAIDPDHDCTFFVSQDALLISVPGSHLHDLAPEIHSTNAPHVLQSVRGDFTIQVRVEPGADPMQPGLTGYNGAAIIAMFDAENFVSLARAVFQRAGEQEQSYANFEIRVGGELQRTGLTGDHPLPKAGAVFLRLERRGSKFLGAVSEDGISWDVLVAKDIPADWPKELQTGVAAISTCKGEFNPRFSKLQILK
jgi:regulation of enolase protein 1 (concanavalin A-like superfamily)